MSVESEKQRLEAGWEGDKRRLKLLNRVTGVIPLFTIPFLFYLLIGRQNWSSSLIALSLYTVFTRVSIMVAYRAYLYPEFLGALADDDASTREAAMALVDTHRKEILYEILRERMEATEDEALAAITREEILSWPEVSAIPARRRLLTLWIAGWGVVTVLVALVVWRTWA